MWHHLSLPLLWCSPSEKSSLFSFYYLEVLWDAVMHRLKCQKIGFWWDCCILLALNHFTQLSLIISHFRWIWNHITSKWDWSFLITSGQTATWRTIIFILTFFNSERSVKCFCFWEDQISFDVFSGHSVSPLLLTGHLVSNSSRGQAWGWETPGQRECEAWYSL